MLKEINCPHCNELVRLKVFLREADIQLEGDAIKTKKEAYFESLPKEDKEFLDLCKMNGVFEAFEKILPFSHKNNVPNNPEKLFLGFINAMRPKLIPNAMRLMWLKIFDGTNIEYRTAQNIGMVIVDGMIRMFIPIGQAGRG